MSIHSHKRPIAYRTASPITEHRSQSEAVFSHASKCSRKTWYCLPRCTRLAVSDAEEQVRALAGRRLQVLTINC
ncbi:MULTISPECIES: hypothetical protein [unclassified Microcoleus]|uniref:hypothetical protein n=1 Tax=unclassified Microcoleus TaxID=2642155 RepID=UPI002FCF2FDC